MRCRPRLLARSCSIRSTAVRPRSTLVRVAHNSGDSYYGQGLFQSTDLGATWTPLAPGTFDRTAFAQLAIDTSQNPPMLFAATGSGVSGNRATAVFAGATR